MQKMSPEDYELSMRISPRARRDRDNHGLRELHVLRLSRTTKAVGRAALRSGSISIFCEGCRTWTGGLEEFPEEWDCPHCDHSYRSEFVVYEAVESAEPVADGDGSVAQ